MKEKRRLWLRYPTLYRSNVGNEFWGYTIHSIRHLEDGERIEELNKEFEVEETVLDESDKHLMYCTDENIKHISPTHEDIEMDIENIVLYEGDEYGVPLSEKE